LRKHHVNEALELSKKLVVDLHGLNRQFKDINPLKPDEAEVARLKQNYYTGNFSRSSLLKQVEDEEKCSV
jgi:hypothetical protein